ncbi:MAG: hypothetical protein WD355_11795 [Balneolaceae bacterium]
MNTTRKPNSFQPGIGTLALFLLIPALLLATPIEIDLSGEWSYNASESDLGDTQFQFAWQTLIISQTSEELSIERRGQGQGGPIEMSESILLSGEESENAWFGDNVRVSTASWTEEDELVIESEAEFSAQGQTNVIRSTETFQLNDDGSVLTITNEVSSSFGEYTQTLVYEKE